MAAKQPIWRISEKSEICNNIEKIPSKFWALFSTLFLGLKLLEKNKNRRCQKPRHSRALEKHYDIPAPKRRRRRRSWHESPQNCILGRWCNIGSWFLVNWLLVLQKKSLFKNVNKFSKSIRPTIMIVVFILLVLKKLWILKIRSFFYSTIYNPRPFLQDKVWEERGALLSKGGNFRFVRKLGVVVENLRYRE